jgi:hypothetical protein
MAKVTCKCGNTYFEKINVNEFYDRTTDLYQQLPEVEVDLDIKMLRCIKCGKYKLNTIDYYGASESDKKLYKRLLDIIEGREPKIEKNIEYGPIQPGSMRPVKIKSGDPSNDGKFVRQDQL